MKNKNMESFFIIGSQRSGTTLLRLILNSHSQIAIPEEGTFWMPLIRLHSKNPDLPIPKRDLSNYLNYIRKNTQFKLWCMDPTSLIHNIESSSEDITLHELMSAFYNEYAIREGKNIWGEKSSVFFRKIPEISKIFPHSRFIHIVRDGRDVFISLRKMDPRKKNIYVSALEWIYKVRKIEKAFDKLSDHRHLTIRYEDLVSHPDDVIKKMCCFLKLDFEKSMIDFWKHSNQYIGSHHSKLIFQPITKASTNKWEKELTHSQKKTFEFLAGKLLKQYGYKSAIEANQIKIHDRFKILFLLIIGLPLRAFQVLYTAIKLWIAAKFGTKTTAAGSGKLPSAKVK